MKSAALALLALILSMSTHAAHAVEKENPERTSKDRNSAPSRLDQGHTRIGGTASLSHTSANRYNKGLLTASLSVPVEHFIVDRWSLGGEASYTYYAYDSGPTYSGYGIGPSTTYYFYADQRLAAFIGTSFTYNKYEDTQAVYVLSPRIGFDLFLSPSVAFTPALHYTRTFSSEAADRYNKFSLSAGFTFYL